MTAQAYRLMQLAMPPFEKFMEHCAALKNECAKADKLTPEREQLFETYQQELLAGREDYERLIASFITDSFTPDEIDLLVAFYEGPTFKVMEKSQSLALTVAAITTGWQTRMLERCPDVWKMLIEDVGEWQAKNTPEGSEVVLPETPHEASEWKRVENVFADTSREEAEIEALRQT